MRLAKKNPRLRPQLGMTLIEIMIVLAIIALVMGLLVGPAVIGSWKKAQVQAARTMTTQIANAWARWRIDATTDCPESVADLKEQLGRRASDALHDPWGHGYVLMCGEDAPPACQSVPCVLSPGPDGKRDTDDDIKNW